MQSVWDYLLIGKQNPKLDFIFDYYLRMIWDISLSIPIPYVEGHLFDMNLTGWAQGFSLSNTAKGSATQLAPNAKDPIQESNLAYQKVLIKTVLKSFLII